MMIFKDLRTKHWDSLIPNYKKMINNLVGNECNNNITDAVWKCKEHEAKRAIEVLDINQGDIVFDVGSGAGMMAFYVAKQCKKLYCIDVSKQFLKYAKKNNSNNQNVKYVKINYGDMTDTPSPTKIYCLAMFMHYHQYDIHNYLKIFYKKLDYNGMVFFDIMPDEQTSPESEMYKKNMDSYLKNPNRVFYDVKQHNPLIIEKIIKTVGFNIVDSFNDHVHKFYILKK